MWGGRGQSGCGGVASWRKLTAEAGQQQDILKLPSRPHRSRWQLQGTGKSRCTLGALPEDTQGAGHRTGEDFLGTSATGSVAPRPLSHGLPARPLPSSVHTLCLVWPTPAFRRPTLSLDGTPAWCPPRAKTVPSLWGSYPGPPTQDSCRRAAVGRGAWVGVGHQALDCFSFSFRCRLL